jgi:hypothetical protein
LKTRETVPNSSRFTRRMEIDFRLLTRTVEERFGLELLVHALDAA